MYAWFVSSNEKFGSWYYLLSSSLLLTVLIILTMANAITLCLLLSPIITKSGRIC
ncbi:hypothetical protein EJK54_0636 [Moraxella catarrhalis]|uniref:Uncharacterized protein n=1 Tax=Moraxella catarrhalis TaxID=480 RepID=A0ABY0BL58_MORCA|nr:hypothetical protein MCRH_0807 [Moraxella catarrhalis RH4]RUO17298.1 hypothetical protein EJK54_0636 [Moraxella catarrhalis]